MGVADRGFEKFRRRSFMETRPSCVLNRNVAFWITLLVFFFLSVTVAVAEQVIITPDKVKREWQDTGYVLGYFGEGQTEARGKYEFFVREGVAQGRRGELTGGGLIRSLGGVDCGPR
jgi:hypothetical protein